MRCECEEEEGGGRKKAGCEDHLDREFVCGVLLEESTFERDEEALCMYSDPSE